MPLCYKFNIDGSITLTVYLSVCICFSSCNSKEVKHIKLYFDYYSPSASLGSKEYFLKSTLASHDFNGNIHVIDCFLAISRREKYISRAYEASANL